MSDILLTQEDINKIKKQIKELKYTIIPKINKELETAIADGDLRENAPFDIAKQRLVEARNKLHELEELIKKAKIVKNKSTQRIGINSKVKIDIDGLVLDIQIVGVVDANPLENKYATNSPIAQAIMGKKPGDTATLNTPDGQQKTIKVLEVK